MGVCLCGWVGGHNRGGLELIFFFVLEGGTV